MAFNRFFNQSGDSATFTLESVTPEKRGHSAGSSTETGMGSWVLEIFTASTDGKVTFRFFTALMSRATPMCEAASARLGVRPISKTESDSTLKYVADNQL